ncbi:hypothetical protein Tco_0064097 [Tanacetum coccineum]
MVLLGKRLMLKSFKLTAIAKLPISFFKCLPPDVYAIVNHHKVAKEIWDRVKLLMKGTKLSLHEKKYKLYDEFDKFSFVKVTSTNIQDSTSSSPHSVPPLSTTTFHPQPQIRVILSDPEPSQQYQSHMGHQASSVPQIAYHSPQASTQPMTEFP